MDEVWFNLCFRESRLRNYKKSSVLRFTDSHVFMFVCLFVFSKSRESTCVQPVVGCIKIICKTNER